VVSLPGVSRSAFSRQCPGASCRWPNGWHLNSRCPYPSPVTMDYCRYFCTFAQELRSDLHLCTVSCPRALVPSASPLVNVSPCQRVPSRKRVSPCHRAHVSPRASACPHVTMPTCPLAATPRSPLHRSSAPICTFALSHVLVPSGHRRRPLSPCPRASMSPLGALRQVAPSRKRVSPRGYAAFSSTHPTKTLPPGSFAKCTTRISRLLRAKIR